MNGLVTKEDVVRASERELREQKEIDKEAEDLRRKKSKVNY